MCLCLNRSYPSNGDYFNLSLLIIATSRKINSSAFLKAPAPAISAPAVEGSAGGFLLFFVCHYGWGLVDARVCACSSHAVCMR